MRPPISSRINKKEFLRKWLSNLHLYKISSPTNSSNSKNKQATTLTLLERKRAIKISADVAMASTRIATSLWSRALISNAGKDYNLTTHSQALLDHIAGPTNDDGAANKGRSKEPNAMKRRLVKRSMMMMRKRIINRMKVVGPVEKRRMRARKIAKRVVKKRTMVLRALVPGGEQMDERCLIRETVDYILSLRAQVDVMQHLADATQNHKLMLNGK